MGFPIHQAIQMKALLFAGLFSLPLLAQRAEIRNAPNFATPAPVDSNSPAFWRNGRLIWFHSTGVPLRSVGTNQFLNQFTMWVSPTTYEHYPMWIEATWYDEERDELYAWYHYEDHSHCPDLAIPSIGALKSYDGGRTFEDLGIVLAAGPEADCSMRNGFFAGGHGDFSVIRNRRGNFFYFLFDNYAGPPASQGVSIARMAFEDRDDPVGKVWKYHRGTYRQPGLGGDVTPVFPVKIGWEAENTDALWGPSVHWNEHLEKFVILMTRTCCTSRWPSAGIYIAYTDAIGLPNDYQQPQLLIEDTGYRPAWYPQVMGLEEGGTDTIAGRIARLWIKGISMWEIVFHREGED